MNIKKFRIRLFIFSFLAFGILAGLAGYAAWLDRSLLHNLQGRIMLGAAPVSWILFYLLALIMLPAGLDEGGEDAAGIRKRLFEIRLLVISFIFFCSVYAAFGAVLHNHLINDKLLIQAMFLSPPAVWLLFYIITAALSPVPYAASPAVQAGPVTPETDKEEVPEEPGKQEAASGYVHEETGPDEDEIRQDAAVQVLSLFQREGRLIDFLQEDIEPYEDAQIGAAVREVHRGCRAVLKDSLGLAPVLDASEGSQVEIDEDFDPSKIKLVGNVHGSPPFTGVLRHCGWKAVELKLPVRTGTFDHSVIAPAEVEI